MELPARAGGGRGGIGTTCLLNVTPQRRALPPHAGRASRQFRLRQRIARPVLARSLHMRRGAWRARRGAWKAANLWRGAGTSPHRLITSTPREGGWGGDCLSASGCIGDPIRSADMDRRRAPGASKPDPIACGDSLPRRAAEGELLPSGNDVSDVRRPVRAGCESGLTGAMLSRVIAAAAAGEPAADDVQPTRRGRGGGGGRGDEGEKGRKLHRVQNVHGVHGLGARDLNGG